ncbi:MAG: hypothetical protein V3574_03015 [Candidatus Moraniibacteriota bacterium]
MLQQNNHNIILPKYFESVKQKGSSLALPANGLGGSRATSSLVAHFALQNTKFGSEKGKVQKPARIPPQTPLAGGKKAEAGQFHSPRKIVCPAESKLVFRIFVKKCSNINQKTPPIFTFCEIVRSCLGAKRLGMIFFRNFEGIFEIARQRAVGNAEVRRAKLWSRSAGQTNLFSFVRQRADERLSVFFFDCPKTNFKTIWTT